MEDAPRLSAPFLTSLLPPGPPAPLPMKLSLAAVTAERPDRVAAVAELARIIWREHYAPILGGDQVEYMLAQFQSEEALRAALAYGQEYWLLRWHGEPAGYLGLAADPGDPEATQLSKIYVRADRRGCGLGRSLLLHAEARATAGKRPRLWLTVNRHNTTSLRWYQRRGFRVSGEVVTEIGHGFVMDDYQLEKSVPGQPGSAPGALSAG